MNPHIRVEFWMEGEGHLVFIFYTDNPLFHNREHFQRSPQMQIYGARINVIGTVPMPTNRMLLCGSCLTVGRRRSA